MSLRFSQIIDGIPLEDLFYCWKRVLIGYSEKFESCKASAHLNFSWDEIEYTKFVKSSYTKPKGNVTVSLRSIELFEYGLFQLRTKMPSWEENSPILWFGFELDDLFGGGVVHYSYHKSTLRISSGRFDGTFELPLSFISSTEIVDKYNVFTIKIYETGAVWRLNDKIVAIAIFTDESKVVSDKPPFALMFSLQPSSRLPILLDIDGGDVNKEWVWEGLHPWGLRVSSGSKHGIVSTNLYISGTFNNVSNREVKGSLELNPLPIPNKLKLFLRTSEPSSLKIEYYINDKWEEVNEFKIRGNHLEILEFNDFGNVVRLHVNGGGKILTSKAEILF